jgi:hypothetical protein
MLREKLSQYEKMYKEQVNSHLKTIEQQKSWVDKFLGKNI